jgi:hypothetical protein
MVGGIAPVPGYASWYDPSDSLTYDGSDNISACGDKGTNGINATQSTGALQPKRIPAGLNGRDVIELTTGSQYLDFGATAPLNIQSAFTIDLTARMDPGGFFPGLLLIKDGVGGRNFSLYRNNGDSKLHVNNPNVGLTWTTQPALGDWFNLIIIFNGVDPSDAANYRLFLNGSEITFSGAAETPPTNRNQWSNQGGVGWVGRFGELFLYQLAFSDTNVATQNAYRLDKWGLP